ncbi:MAG: molybdenum cofactor guanylyltransferase [Elusimicrobia bacterium]|nr:molybdenum cofactor guanylyltransferase [Elusimicrobiota bacterium]
MAQVIDELTGVVLAGGRSSRFGANKALADWKGATLVETVIGSLLEVLPKVLVATKNAGELEFLQNARVRIVEDLHRDGHPMGGLLSALQRVETNRVFVAACDMPFVRPELIEALWVSRADYDAVIPVWRGKRQPLCGIYSRDCAGIMRASIREDELGISRIFDSLRTRFMLESEVQGVDPQGFSFMDIDTREDYERARGLRPC